MVGSVGGDGGQVESDAGDRSADDDPWRALAETAVGGVGQRAEDDVGDQGEDDADGVHRAEDRFALTDAERVEAGWEQHGGSDGAGHHEDDAEEDEARAEASKIQFAHRFTGVGSEFLGGSSLGWSVFFGAIAVMIPFGYWFTFANTHEIASMKPGDGVDGRAGRIPVGDHFKALARNKYWWLTLGLNDLQRHGRLHRQVRARQLQSDRRDRSGDSDPHGHRPAVRRTARGPVRQTQRLDGRPGARRRRQSAGVRRSEQPVGVLRLHHRAHGRHHPDERRAQRHERRRGGIWRMAQRRAVRWHRVQLVQLLHEGGHGRFLGRHRVDTRGQRI